MSLQISHITLAMTPAPCQCHCFYCTQEGGIAFGWEKNPDVKSAYARLFDATEDGSLANQVFSSKIIESAARITAIHVKEIGSVSFSNFTEEEKRQIITLAKEILQYM